MSLFNNLFRIASMTGMVPKFISGPRKLYNLSKISKNMVLEARGIKPPQKKKTYNAH